ncbi:probable glutamate receptor [Periplaneta americana]|uniref:probable glutamate receptor n=1 Tax=Periplaneta americana TaxID=6978 RepID=UPI0037E74E4C
MLGFMLTAIMTTCLAASSDFPTEDLVSIASRVLQRYHAPGVVVLQHRGLQEDSEVANIFTSLSEQHVMAVSCYIGELMSSEKKLNYRSIFLLLSSDELTRQTLLQASAAGDLSRIRWLLFMDSTTLLKEFFDKLFIPFDCDFLVAQRCGDTTEVSLTEVYHIHNIRPLQTFRVAKWSPREMSWSSETFHERRGSLQGVSIKAAVIPYKPYLNVAKYDGKTPVKFEGYLMDLWNELQHRMNFTTKFVTSHDAVFGFLLDNGSWSGVVGMVLREEVDVGISFFAYLKDRIDAVSFLPPIWNVRLKVHMKQPEMEVSTFSHILSPFVSSLWGVVAATMAVLSLLLAATWYLSPTSKFKDGSLPCNLYESCLYVYGSFCQQGHDTVPKTMACRLVYFSTYFLAVILFVAYSAIFISYLTVRRTELPFNDFQGLLRQGSYKLGVLAGSARIDFFKKSKIPALKDIYKHLIFPDITKLPRSDTEGLHRICSSDKYSYLVSDVTLRGLARHIPCKIVGVPQAYYSITASMIIRKSSPYKKLFNYHVQEIKRAGILTRIEENAWPPKYVEIIEDPPSSVPLETVMIFFVVLVTGISVSILILLIEFLLTKLTQSEKPCQCLPLYSKFSQTLILKFHRLNKSDSRENAIDFR